MTRPTEWNQQRQGTRGKDGRYARLPPCPRCLKRKCLEPAYTKSEGGADKGTYVNDDSPWAGLFICNKCVREEGK